MENQCQVKNPGRKLKIFIVQNRWLFAVGCQLMSFDETGHEQTQSEDHYQQGHSCAQRHADQNGIHNVRVGPIWDVVFRQDQAKVFSLVLCFARF